MDRIGQPFAPAEFYAAAPPASVPDAPSIIPTLLLIAWICGFAAVLILWCVRWWRVAVLVRAARPLREGFVLMSLRRLEQIAGVAWPIELRSSPSRMEPGVFGILRQVLLLPENISRHFWTKRNWMRSSPTSYATCVAAITSLPRFTCWWKLPSGFIRWCGGSARA